MTEISTRVWFDEQIWDRVRRRAIAEGVTVRELLPRLLGAALSPAAASQPAPRHAEPPAAPPDAGEAGHPGAPLMPLSEHYTCSVCGTQLRLGGVSQHMNRHLKEQQASQDEKELTMAVSAERMQDLRLDLLNLIEVYKDMLESVNPVFLLSEYATEEGAPTDDEMNRLRDEVLPKIHQRYLTLYSTIEDKVSQMLRQYGDLCQEALQTIGEQNNTDRMDLRLGLSTEVQRGIMVITDALKALKPRDILQAYRTAKRAPSRTFDMMFRELEPKIQKKYLDTVSDSYEILTMLAEKAAVAAMSVGRENGRSSEAAGQAPL